MNSSSIQLSEPFSAGNALKRPNDPPRGKPMKSSSRLAIAISFAALAACGSSNTANNNTADVNAGTDLNAGSADMNTTADMNGTGNTGMNSAGAGTGATNAAGNATGNSGGNAY
jgi:hypothetical protein